MSIYKECDIRGVYEKEFDAETAYAIGRAVGSLLHGRTLALGGDVRVSTPPLKRRLIQGLRDSGANVVDIGMVPTPAFYFALKHLPVDGGITVTASHNPPEYNGFKLMFGDSPVTPGDIGRIRRLVETNEFKSGKGTLSYENVYPAYKASLYGRFEGGSLRVVIDAANGAMSELAPRVLKRLGYDVIPLYCEFDGRFPNRDPNPAVYSNLGDLCKAVKRSRASLGIAFDGDGDRVVFVDENGDVVNSEASLCVLVNEYVKERPFSVVYDLKSSSAVQKTVLANGGTPIMERSGHAFIKKRFLENGSVLAGEISGHFFFGELGYDDGLFAALVMAKIVESSPLSKLAGRLPKTLISPDIRVFCPYSERDSWLDAVRSLGDESNVSELDGVRVQFANGWLLVRKSVTEEGVTIRMEADDGAALAEIKQRLLRALPKLGAHPFIASSIK